MSLRLCQAFLPLISKFTYSDPAEESKATDDKVAGGQPLYATPKTAEELIALLEKI